MKKYYYCVNTFDKDEIPVQLDGYVEATSERDAIKKLIIEGLVDRHGYEFLELYEVRSNNK